MKSFVFSLFNTVLKPFRNLGLRNRFALVDRAYRFILSKIRPEYTEVHGGMKIFLDRNDSLEFSVRTFEPGVTNLFKRYVTSGARVLDIGAHIGYYTLLSSQLVGPKGKVYAFEPNPENGALLAKSIEMNGLHNVELTKKAVGREEGKAHLYLSGVSNENQCYYVEGRSHVEVEVVTLDSFFRDLPGVDFMKIDVDGFEINILHGAEKLIQKSKNLMMVTEFSPHHLMTAGEDPREYFNYLVRLGFKMSLIDERTGEVRPVAVDELLKETNTSYNLFCVKS